MLIAIPGVLFYIAASLALARTGNAAAFTSSLFDLSGLFALYMFVEGIVRCLAALASEQVLPMLILQIPAWIQDSSDQKERERSLGPLIPDKVERGQGQPYDLCIRSCRPKPYWNPYMTIRFEDEFYQMFKEDQVVGRQPFIYYLRKNPPGRLVVVIFEYSPDDVLNPLYKPARWKPK